MEPIVKATIQAAILSAISNTLAQLISCHRAGHGYSLDTGPLVTFVTFSLLSCPPNYLWQSWLESTFPGYTSPDDAGTVASIAQQPQVKAALDAAAPTLQRIEETASPVLQKASAATTALADSDAVKNARRRAGEGVDTVKAKAKELEARASINQSPMAKSPTRSQTFSTHDGHAVEKKVDTTFTQPPPSSSPKAL
ncbi:MFS general substrate transporter, partial [Aureobasidium melanogenum]